MEPDEAVEPSNLPQLYTGADIRVLEWPEAIRLRPGMYVGGVDARGLETLLVDYLIAEFLLESAGVGLRSLSVRLRDDGSATVGAEGPLPALGAGRWPADLAGAMTRIHHSGHQFLGLPCLAALSESVAVEARHAGAFLRQTFARGYVASSLERLGEAADEGISFDFRPDPEIFRGATFDAESIENRLSDLAAFFPEARFKFVDDRAGRSRTWERWGGLLDLVAERNSGRRPIHDAIGIEGKSGDVEFRAAFQYHEGPEVDLHALANWAKVDGSGSIPGDRPGARGRGSGRSSHVVGFLNGLRRALFPDPRPHDRRFRPARMPAERILSGLTAVVAVRLDDPWYYGASRETVGNPQALHVASSISYLQIHDHFHRDPEARRRIEAKIRREPEAR